jgi:flagellar FliJ protein
MKNRLSRMLTIVNLAKVDLESVEKNLQSINSQLHLNQKQQESLISYQNEYLEKLRNTATTTLQEINSTQAFLGKLSQAIEHQKTEIKNLENMLEQAKDFWVEKKIRAQSLEKLYHKLLKKQALNLDRQEQKMMDDLVANNFILR